MAEEPTCFLVKTYNGEYRACAIVLAFGKTPRDLGVTGENNLNGEGGILLRRLNGPFFKGKAVAVTAARRPGAR